MPVLHKYKDKDTYYVLTSINGNIITFQLNNEGQHKLISAGIMNGQQFGRALLLDLYRSGDAYTYGTGPGTTELFFDERQMQFDFKNDPEPETLFPSCSNCTSINDLHIVELKNTDRVASILCTKCRVTRRDEIDASVPLALVTRTILSRFLKMINFNKVEEAVLSYQSLLNAEFASKWEALRQKKHIQQEALFEAGDNNQGKLI